jgi:hypothetical protein
VVVWNKTKLWVDGVRQELNNPLMLRNLQDIAEDTLQWHQRQTEKSR